MYAADRIELGGTKMPIHDWTRVTAGTWHAFHLSWISEIQEALNAGLLPPDYYAQAEQIAGPMAPDVLTLQMPGDSGNGVTAKSASESNSGGVAVAVRPPRMRMTAEIEIDEYALKRRTLVIRHASDDRIVALLELVSPGNKSSSHAYRTFVDKAIAALQLGYHLLIVDLFPAGPRDPQGIHGAIWAELGEPSFKLPGGESLTLVAYSAGHPKTAYIEPTAVGRVLIDMPLFLTPETYVEVPLESTYQGAYRGVPRKWRSVLETPAPQ
jgi:hypothetical protein